MSIIDFFSNLFGSHVEDLTSSVPGVSDIVDSAIQTGTDAVESVTQGAQDITEQIPGQVDDQIVDQVTENLPGKQ